MSSALPAVDSAPQKPRLSLPESCRPPADDVPTKQLAWIIFGATGHIGRHLVRTATSKGDLVTAVAWSREHSDAELEGWSNDGVLWTACDIRIRESVDVVVNKTIARWGRIDLIAVCVTFGIIGACEDQDDTEMRDQFEINFFGALNVLQASIPYFRSQNKGRYLIFSSTSGALGVPGLGPYCATKYAVEGLIESMLYEVDCYNIKATLVQPGHLRRDEPDPSVAAVNTAAGDQAIANVAHPIRFSAFKVKIASAPYAGPNSPAGHAKRMIALMDARQPTSAVRSAELCWQLGHCEFPPLRLLLGGFAVESIRDRLKSVVEEIEDWKHLHFPGGTADHDGGDGHEHEHEHEHDDGYGGSDTSEDGGAGGHMDEYEAMREEDYL